MADTRSPSPKKIHPDNEDLESMSKPDLIARLKEQDQYIKQLESKKARYVKGDDDGDMGERLKQQQKEAARRENTLVHRLTTKEQELQDYVTQVAEMKQAQTQGTTQLKSMLLDPAVNIVFQRMAKELEETQEKLKQTQNELSAWKFTPDSQTGKRLMARCQMLLQENEELGKTIASGRTAKLEGEIALQKTLVSEMKNNQSELDEFLGDLEEDVEGMQTMIYVLQQQLREAKDTISSLEDENTRLRAGDTSVPATRLSSQIKRLTSSDSKSSVVKTETSTNQSYTSSGAGNQPLGIKNYSAIETKYYEERTDSDLEADYSYEGMYENDDQLQDELERQHSYEENGYKNYEEDYHSQTDYNKEGSYPEQETGEEPMETDDTSATQQKSSANTSTDSHQTNNGTACAVLTMSKDQHGSSTRKTNSSPDPGDSNRQQTDHSTSNSKAETSVQETTRVKQENRQADDHLSKQSRQAEDANSPERSARIPSPKPTKVSPSRHCVAKQQKTSTEDSSSHPVQTSKDSSTNGSPGNHASSPTTNSSSSPKQLTGNVNETRTQKDGSQSNSLTSNDRSPVTAAGAPREREPVLQKMFNGVSSTVDDIEDL